MSTNRPITAREPLIKQLLRFSVTGIFAGGSHFLSVILLVQLTPLVPLEANVLGFFCGFFVSFYGHRHWTFRGHQQTMQRSLAKFLCIAAINLVVNQSLFFCLFRLAHWPYPLALLVTVLTLASVTFTLSKFWAFRHGGGS